VGRRRPNHPRTGLFLPSLIEPLDDMCERGLVSRRLLSTDSYAGEHYLQARDTSVITGQKCLNHRALTCWCRIPPALCAGVDDPLRYWIDGRPVQGRRLTPVSPLSPAKLTGNLLHVKGP
jgi:hypothetical protein